MDPCSACSRQRPFATPGAAHAPKTICVGKVSVAFLHGNIGALEGKATDVSAIPRHGHGEVVAGQPPMKPLHAPAFDTYFLPRPTGKLRSRALGVPFLVAWRSDATRLPA